MLLAAAAAGCSAPGPIEGGALDRLREQVKEARPGSVRVTTVGRSPGAAGPAAAVVMPFVSHGTKVAEFPLYDGYFKVALAVAEELRALGFEAGLAPRIWGAREEATAFETRNLDDQAVERNLSAIAAQEDIQALYRLTPAERRALLVARLVFLSARSALAPGRLAKGRVTAREIRNAYFAPDGAAPPRYALEAEVVELSAGAEEKTFSGERRGRAKIALKLLGWNGAPIVSREVACEAAAAGTGVTFRALGATYSFAMGPDDPLELAIRGCVRAFVAEAVPKLGAP